MKIILTGCAGFIGSRVCEKLLGKGHELVGLDNMNDAYDSRLKDFRLDKLLNSQNFNFHKTDISNLDELTKIFNQHSDADAVMNLAARAGVRTSIDIPQEYFYTNVIGTVNVLQLCVKHNIQKLVQASTSSLYGENTTPFREDMNTDRTLSPYAASKKAAENICYTYNKLYNTDISILRYFTVYGPAGRPDMSPFRFIRWIMEEEKVVLYGNGEFERDFTFVDDIAEGTILSLKNVGYEIVNLGNNKPFKMKELIKEIEYLAEKKANVDMRPEQMADVSATCADISKAKDKLGWEPKTGLSDGLKICVEWYKKNREFAKSINIALN